MLHTTTDSHMPVNLFVCHSAQAVQLQRTRVFTSISKVLAYSTRCTKKLDSL